MHLTPAALEAMYAYLVVTPPFNGWDLPTVDAVEFRVGESPLSSCYGWHRELRGRHVIAISPKHCRHSIPLLEAMAHEICHLRQRATDGSRESADHGPKWQSLAKAVCRQHGFDRAAF